MKDLIDRREAIDALDRAAECWNIAEPFNEGMRAGYKAAVTIVLSLPSAQPEIIRCRDCKYAEVADKEDSQDGYTCQFHRGSIWFGGSYCSWAERREVSE